MSKVMDYLPKLTLPKEVSIKNERLNYMYYGMYIPVLAYAVFTFYSGRSYTETIPNQPCLKLEQTFANFDIASFNKSVPQHLQNMCNAMTVTDEDCQAGGSLAEMCMMMEKQVMTYNKAFGSLACKQVCSRDLPLESHCFVNFDALFAQGAFGYSVTLYESVVANFRYAKQFYMDVKVNTLQVIFAEINLTYSFKLTRSVPWFFGAERQVRTVGTGSHAITLIINHDRSVRNVYQPGEEIVKNVLEISEMAGDPLTFEAGRSGRQIQASVNCFTDTADMPPLTWGDQKVMSPSQWTPVCIIEAELVGKSTLEQVSINSTHYKMKTSWKLEAVPGSSYSRIFSTSAIITMLISIVVLMGLPVKIIKLFMLNFLGTISILYKRLFLQAFSIDASMQQMITRMIGSGPAYAQLLDKPGSEAVSKQRFEEELGKIFSCRGHPLGSMQLDSLVKLCFDHQTHKEPRTTRSDVADAFGSDGVLTLELIANLLDATRPRTILEKAFSPLPIRKLVSAGRKAMEEGEDVEAMEGPPPLLRSTDAHYEMQRFVDSQLQELESRLERRLNDAVADLQARMDAKASASESSIRLMLKGFGMDEQSSQDHGMRSRSTLGAASPLPTEAKPGQLLADVEVKFMAKLEDIQRQLQEYGQCSAREFAELEESIRQGSVSEKQMQPFQAAAFNDQMHSLEASLKAQISAVGISCEQIGQGLRALEATVVNHSRLLTKFPVSPASSFRESDHMGKTQLRV
eukprot:TRINITY_DN29340_c0_g1_i1.p1 TRINITY_DN29340_c0_g1~~TRINITY_DN29340_c0_g1_i1.p1  ORF type:complete len:743 (+),score=116.69 TRINITY_DN29340_c0_g1_i1:25-2253(+)